MRLLIVKISGPYQISNLPGYGDVQAIARLFVSSAPDQIIWGSDWPHTGGTRRPADQSLDVIEGSGKKMTGSTSICSASGCRMLAPCA